LGIALTSRGKGPDGAPVPLAGVPAVALETNLAALVRAGHKVALCEEHADAAPIAARGGRPGQALRARRVVRVYTPGTLVEEGLLAAAEPRYLAAVTPTEVAWCDVAAGALWVEALDGPGAPAAALARIDPAELLAPQDWADGPLAPVLRDYAARLSPVLPEAFARGAAGAVRSYLRQTGTDTQHFATPRRLESASVMAIDPATRRNLELTRTLSGARRGSLLHAIDRCATPAGQRLLAEDLRAPLTDVTAIEARLARVSALVDRPETRAALRDRLAETPDMARAVGRLAIGRWAPRDLVALRDGLAVAERLRGMLQADLGTRAAYDTLIERLRLAPDLAALALKLREGVADDGAIADGFDPALDAQRAAARRAEGEIAALEARWRRETGIARLRITSTEQLGHFVEVPPRAAGPLMAAGSGFAHRQTLAGAVRFRAEALTEAARALEEATARARALEDAARTALADALRAHGPALTTTARALARLDVAAGLADLAAEKGWARPVVTLEATWEVAAGRHAVLDGPGFTPNDCALTVAPRMVVLTGANMAGKSTYLRQNALIAILAQAGAFVPARTAYIGVADALFCRVGAGDDLARGRSTFLVEMEETAAILRGATGRSLVILDEVGRGTATFDGLAIAQAVVEALAAGPQPRALVSTHYTELAQAAAHLPGCAARRMAVHAGPEGLTFGYRVEDGVADGAFGLHAARVAGVPEGVVARAAEILTALAAGRATPPRC
jgi:DNA mismatch repair protein MutS